MMHDYQSMNDQQHRPQRATIQIDPETHTRKLINIIKKKSDPNQQNSDETAHGNNRANTKDKHEEIAPGNAIRFADDTELISQHDTPTQLVRNLINYDKITKTRQLSTQWGKVAITTRKRNTGKSEKYYHHYYKK